VTAFQSVAVLGAGTMGHGIAQVAAAAGSRVALYDVDAAAAPRARDRIRANLDKGVSLGKVTAQALGETMDRIRTTSDLAAAVRDADLVIEAAPESLELKRSLLREVEQAVPQDVVLATNTSSLSIAELADGLSAPARFLGLHFFNPVHVMALVEVVWGPATGRLELERAISYVQELGKEPVVVKDSPGFASSRLGVLLGLEAMRMVEEGVAEPAGIDRAMELGYRHPMGPLKLTDLVGLDVRLGIAEYLHGRLGSEAFRPPAILRRMVEEGKLGKKTGEGFYRWEDKS
jgi:3-hydroxybutyryl-CoA dehydrogenase